MRVKHWSPCRVQMQLTLKHTAGNFVISLLSVFANQVLIMQNFPDWSIALVTSVAKTIPFGRRRKLCIGTVLLLRVCLFKAKLKCFFFSDISQCRQIYESLRERYMNMNHLREMLSSVMMNYIFVSDGLSMFFSYKRRCGQVFLYDIHTHRYLHNYRSDKCTYTHINTVLRETQGFFLLLLYKNYISFLSPKLFS